MGCPIHPDNAKRLVSVLQLFGFSVPELSDDLFLQKDKIIRMGVPPMRIEILTSISGVAFEECYTNRIVEEIDGIPVNLIALKQLRQNKRASGRYKDLNDLEHLR